VLDPFAGSGTTGVAARLEGRRALLIEQEDAYCETTQRRLEPIRGAGCQPAQKGNGPAFAGPNGATR
jgi:DNA modification methylase